MDPEAVRTFVAVADEGQIQLAAAGLGITQQAASKRIAALERQLGVRLLLRTPRGARLTLDGTAFLPHARAVLAAVAEAEAAVRPGARPLRVDVLGTRVSTAGLLQDFHRAHPDAALDVTVVRTAGRAALEAVRDGSVDASFWAHSLPAERLPAPVRTARVLDEPAVLAVGPAHPLAGRETVSPADLGGLRILMPGLDPTSEWGVYYAEFAAAFGFRLDASGPAFGMEHMARTITASDDLGTFIGTRTPLTRPTGLGLHFVALARPTPVYPHWLLWRDDNPHPALRLLRAHLADRYEREPVPDDELWVPDWSANRA
ncbi:LysR family transcriptional regulator [Streptomyces sp. NPDC059639]|uniref:LysR family transcriptional regulator n=1 Tax=Streptomyces sp. NPDC059639 TaxID=3346891 RepID=UPI00369E3441